jgi:hypothetical protein
MARALSVRAAPTRFRRARARDADHRRLERRQRKRWSVLAQHPLDWWVS